MHFLIVGAALFLTFGLTQEQSDDDANRILVDAGQVEQLAAQFQRTWLRPPTEKELAGLIESHVRDEVYYREALAMGLDRNDRIVRQRMRQKLEFILEDLTAGEPPSDEVLSAFLQQHADRFRVPPKVWFRQIYLNPDKRADLAADAGQMLADLREGAAPETLGDRIMLPYEYPAALQVEIARTFGGAFAEEVVALQAGTWTGPVYSGLGGHLVLVTARKEGRLPELAEVRTQVEREYLARRRQELKDLAYQRLREGYEVIVEPVTVPGDPRDDALAATRSEPSGG